MLEVRGVRKSYGNHPALAGVDLTVAPGEIVAMLGPNGAGKSTLLSLISGLRRPDSGTIHFAGADLGSRSGRRGLRLGFAPQDTGVYRSLTVRENLEFFGDLNGLGGRDRARRATEVATLLGLDDLLSRPAHQLSGGEQRRLHTGCALVHQPDLLLLDEPTVGADVHTRVQLIDVVKALAADGAAVIYTTHYLPEVEDLDARVVIIDHGRVVAEGTLEQLTSQHRMEAVELTFAGPAPSLPPDRVSPGWTVTVEGDSLRVVGTADLGEVLPLIATDAGRIRGAEVIRPDLEGAFLALTGRRYGVGEQE